MLEKWSPLQPQDALALLNSDFPDSHIREYATKRVSLMCDSDFALYAGLVEPRRSVVGGIPLIHLFKMLFIALDDEMGPFFLFNRLAIREDACEF